MIQVVAAAIVRNGEVLVARRSHPPQVAGRWEFPGGKVHAGETPEAALIREIAEELGCGITVEAWLASPALSPESRIDLRVAACRLTSGTPVAHEHEALRWLAPEALGTLDWLEPDRPFLPELRERLLDGEPLPGGNVGGAVRVGDTVRRPTGPWTPAVHALLAHLATTGLPGIPRSHGLDDRGREILDFLPGEVIDVDTELLGDARLAALGRWLRSLHDAARAFDHPGPWRFFGVQRPELIAHNDVAPYNVAFDGDEVAGVFDWDLAGPSTPAYDLGLTAWTAIPLFRPTPPAAAAQRLELFAGAYGVGAVEVLDAVPPRIQLAIAGIREAVRRGDAGMRNLAATGEPERTEVALAAFLERAPGIRALL